LETVILERKVLYISGAATYKKDDDYAVSGFPRDSDENLSTAVGISLPFDRDRNPR